MVCRLYRNFYAYDRTQDQSTEQMLEDVRDHAISPHDTAVTSMHSEQEVPAFDQAYLNQENHK